MVNMAIPNNLRRKTVRLASGEATRKQHRKRASLADLAFKDYLTAVGSNDLPTDIEAQSRAWRAAATPWLGAVKTLEYSL